MTSVNDTVRVDWLDIISSSEDLTLRQALKMRPVTCTSYGRILAIDNEILILTNDIFSKDEDDGPEVYRQTIAIPRVVIQKITLLKEAQDEVTLAQT